MKKKIQNFKYLRDKLLLILIKFWHQKFIAENSLKEQARSLGATCKVERILPFYRQFQETWFQINKGSKWITKVDADYTTELTIVWLLSFCWVIMQLPPCYARVTLNSWRIHINGLTFEATKAPWAKSTGSIDTQHRKLHIRLCLSTLIIDSFFYLLFMGPYNCC